MSPFRPTDEKVVFALGYDYILMNKLLTRRVLGFSARLEPDIRAATQGYYHHTFSQKRHLVLLHLSRQLSKIQRRAADLHSRKIHFFFFQTTEILIDSYRTLI